MKWGMLNIFSLKINKEFVANENNMLSDSLLLFSLSTANDKDICMWPCLCRHIVFLQYSYADFKRCTGKL